MRVLRNAFLGLLGILLGVFLVLWGTSGGDDTSDEKATAEPSGVATTSSASEPASESPTPSEEPSPSTTPTPFNSDTCGNQDAITSFLAEARLFEGDGDFVQEGDLLNWAKYDTDQRKADVKRGFSGSLLRSGGDVATFVKTPTGRAHAGNKHLTEGLNQRAYSPVQFLKKVPYNGAWSWDSKKEKAVWSDETRNTSVGEVWWFYVDTDTCTVIGDDTVHSDGTIGFASLN